MAGPARKGIAALLLAAAAVTAACGARTSLDETREPDERGRDSAPDRGEGFDASADVTTDAEPDSHDASLDALDETSHARDSAARADAEADSGADADSGAGADAADASPCATVYVDAVHGSDSSDGSAGSPFRTITKAATVAAANTCVTTIRVAEGTYDAALGEAFPITVPAGVALVGDEPNKGAASGAEVFVHGLGSYRLPLWATLLMSSGSTLAGLEITPTAIPPGDAGNEFPEGVVLDYPTTNVTLRNNTILNAHDGVYLTGTHDAVLVGNVVKGCFVGLAHVGGSTSKVESNVVTQNSYGVDADTPGPDVGGGAFGSAGRNVLSCNGKNASLWEGSVAMANNYWDHVPPTTTSIGGAHADILLAGGMPSTLSGAMLASPNCP